MRDNGGLSVMKINFKSDEEYEAFIKLINDPPPTSYFVRKLVTDYRAEMVRHENDDDSFK